jgi:hypothetical protein
MPNLASHQRGVVRTTIRLAATNGTNRMSKTLVDARLAKEIVMLSTILIIVLILVLIGALPTWPYSSGWGYGPGGILGLVLVVVLILALMGRI